MKPLCPKCGSNNIIYNGYTATGKQRYKCKNCKKLYVENPSRPKVSDEKKNTVKKLMVERITLAGISRATGVSTTWLQNFANSVYENVDRTIQYVKKKSD